MPATEIDVPLDAFGTILIFLVGVPALVIQSMSAEVRRAALTRWKWIIFETGLPVAAALLLFAIGVFFEMRLVGNPQPSLLLSLRWVIIFVMLFALSIYTAIALPLRYGRREPIIQMLERRASGSMRETKVLRETELDDLIELGRQSHPGQDKDLVIASLRRLAMAITSAPDYAGDGLEDLITGLVKVLDDGALPSTAANYDHARQLLSEIVRTIGRTPDVSEAPHDLTFVVQALRQLGKATLRHHGAAIDLDAIAKGFIQTLRTVATRFPAFTRSACSALFDIGEAGLASRHAWVTIDALSAQVGLVSAQDEETLRGDDGIMAHVIGLMALLWREHPSAHPFVTKQFQRLDSLSGDASSTLCAHAHEHFVGQTLFSVADAIPPMEKGIVG